MGTGLTHHWKSCHGYSVTQVTTGKLPTTHHLSQQCSSAFSTLTADDYWIGSYSSAWDHWSPSPSSSVAQEGTLLVCNAAGCMKAPSTKIYHWEVSQKLSHFPRMTRQHSVILSQIKEEIAICVFCKTLPNLQPLFIHWQPWAESRTFNVKNWMLLDKIDSYSCNMQGLRESTQSESSTGFPPTPVTVRCSPNTDPSKYCSEMVPNSALTDLIRWPCTVLENKCLLPLPNKAHEYQHCPYKRCYLSRKDKCTKAQTHTLLQSYLGLARLLSWKKKKPNQTVHSSGGRGSQQKATAV